MRPRKRIAYLASPLQVDLEHDPPRLAVELRAQSAVAVAGVDRVLDEVAAADPLLELLRREEVVVAAVDFPRAGRPGGGGDRQLEAM
jgi:hypothetical protein